MDYYNVLNVSEKANQEEIKKAYRKEALKHHPGIAFDLYGKDINHSPFILYYIIKNLVDLMEHLHPYLQ